VPLCHCSGLLFYCLECRHGRSINSDIFIVCSGQTIDWSWSCWRWWWCWWRWGWLMIRIYMCTWPWRWLPDNAVNSSFGICPCRLNLCNGRSTRRLPMTSTGNWGTWPNSWPTSSSTWSSTFPWAAGAPGGECHCLLTRFTGPYSIPTDKLMQSIVWSG